MRSFVRVLFFAAALLLALPFLASSLLLDQRGILIPGHIINKHEYITVDYSTWARHLEAEVQYEPPDDHNVAFLNAQLGQDDFDNLRKGDVVQLRYLLRKDLPDWPGLKTMRQMHVLPFVRLASAHTWTGPAALISEHRHALTAALAIGLALLIWRVLRLPFFQWAFIACCLIGVVFTSVKMFPKPMRAPRQGLRTASGTVKSLEQWRFLFRSKQDRSAIRWVADQPIAVAGVEFIPEGKTDSVLAVDLIDDGSLPGLAENSVVNVDYESTSPRVAYIRGATRHFVQRNLKGLASQLFYMLIVTVVLLSIGKAIGLMVGKLTRQSSR